MCSHTALAPETCSTAPDDDDYAGKVHFRLGWHEQTGALVVHVIEASELYPMDKVTGLSDPYIKVRAHDART
jgi:hypothetical protein